MEIGSSPRPRPRAIARTMLRMQRREATLTTLAGLGAMASGGAGATGATSATSAIPSNWRYFSDRVMGGVSDGSLAEETLAGRRAHVLRGRVRLENNGGFVQMALELPAAQRPPPGAQGVELEVLGNGRRYGVHLRTGAVTAPWQAWRASFVATPEWQTVRLPFAGFVPYRINAALQPGDIRRLGVVAIGEAFEAEVAVARLAWY